MRGAFNRALSSIGLLLTVTLLLVPAKLVAQETGTLLVTVRRSDSTPLPGAFVRSERIGGIANDTGVAKVELPARLVTVLVSYPGFLSRSFEITILPGVSQRFELTLEPRPRDGASATIQSTRAGHRLDEEPIPIKIIGLDQLTERTLLHPTDLTRAFAGTGALRIQTESGPLDGNRLRADGLPGQYTGLLIDGMPLLGGIPSAYSLMQLSPIEFGQIEWIKGPASAWYGSQAPGGLVNLVSRRPDRDQVRLSFGQSSEKGGDLALWAGRRQTPTLSGSLFADVHQQRLVDSDEDGWGEFTRAIRFSVRPRLFVDRPNGDGVVVSAGVMTEDRTGGFLVNDTGQPQYREERRTARLDGSVVARRVVGMTGILQLKVSGMFQSVSDRFAATLDRDRRTTFFGESSYQGRFGRATVTAGLAIQRDALRVLELPDFDYTLTVPAAFASATMALTERISTSIAGRCEHDSVHGLQCVPRGDLLFRPSSRVEGRLFVAGGYTRPTPLADDAETLGFHTLYPIAAKLERLAAAGLDVQWRSDALTLGAAASFSRVGLPIRLVPIPGDPAGRLRLLNLDEPTRIFALDLRATYRRNPFVLGAFAGYRNGTEGIPGSTGRRDATFTPDVFGLNGEWRSPSGSGTTVSADFVVTGEQAISDNPFRTTSPVYGLLNGLVSQRSGRARLYLSGENLLDVKLANYEAVFLTTPAAAGRRTNTPWVPVRGLVISLGAMVDW